VRASDIVNQLSVLLPQLTDKFTTDVAAKSISRSGTVMTAVCNDKHKLQPGQAFAIVGTDVPIPISSLTRIGKITTLVTTTDHDLTNRIAKTIRITGASEAQFNGTFTRINIVNRRTITFTTVGTNLVTMDSEASKWAEFNVDLFDESTIVAPVLSPGSLKAVFNTAVVQFNVFRDFVPFVDISTSTALSFWIYVDSATHANLKATNTISIKLGSVNGLGSDWNEYRFNSSSIPSANTWTQLFIDIVNDSPTASNGTIDLTKIRTIKLQVIGTVAFAIGDTTYFDDVDTHKTVATGSPVLRDAESALRTYNTTHKVDSVVDEVTFKFAHSVVGLPDPDGTLLIRTKPRISSGINIDRIKQLYTEHGVDTYWAFVVIDDVNASQSRLIASDALDNQQRNVNYRQQIIESFTVYVIIPVSDEIAAVESRDIASDLLRPFLRSLLFSQFSTGLYADKLNRVQFTGHGVRDYDTSVYIHAYSFQQVAEIYEEDTVGPDLDVAMRDIDFKMFLDFGTQIEFLRGTPDLDDTPL